MFTGLIEDIGQIVEVENLQGSKKFSVKVNLPLDDIKIGASVAINGACQTVIEKKGNILTFLAMGETLNRTNFGAFKKGDNVNLERAMALGDRLDGHLVGGHIDCTARVSAIQYDGVAKIFSFKCNTDLIVEKGSIAINGISLTVSGVSAENFSVSILPHTFEHTNLKYLKLGDCVNIEYSLIGKYIKKFTENSKKSKITKEFLIENGF